eukprot:7969190-Karenia_brevis.AAC.1
MSTMLMNKMGTRCNQLNPRAQIFVPGSEYHTITTNYTNSYATDSSGHANNRSSQLSWTKNSTLDLFHALWPCELAAWKASGAKCRHD